LAGKTETFYQAEAPWMARKAAVKPGWPFGACLIKCKVSRSQLQQAFSTRSYSAKTIYALQKIQYNFGGAGKCNK